jgi:hypothetical protein
MFSFKVLGLVSSVGKWSAGAIGLIGLLVRLSFLVLLRVGNPRSGVERSCLSVVWEMFSSEVLGLVSSVLKWSTGAIGLVGLLVR